MHSKKIYSFGAIAVIVFFTWVFSGSREKNEEFSEVVKISLRDVGNQLLLSNNDATSLVLPVVELEESKYKLSFQHQLSIVPGSLVSIVKRSFQKSALPKYYRVEVIQCADQEVVYSYEIKNKDENSIIPCQGRFLPKNCYTIEVRFTNSTAFLFSKKALLFILIFVVFLLLASFFYKRKQPRVSEESSKDYATIGSFKFYPTQNKLVTDVTEISLSRKECELLEIFVANPNQIIKRDELTKKVWEDNGVFVSRSLDTYISKLRKKLIADGSIKLTNIHGVGYKLELNN